MLTALRHLMAWVVRNDASALSFAGTTGAAATATSWHGDHWRNLLCSPMDARHYVMEDWTVLPEPETAAARNSMRRR